MEYDHGNKMFLGDIGEEDNSHMFHMPLPSSSSTISNKISYVSMFHMPLTIPYHYFRLIDYEYIVSIQI